MSVDHNGGNVIPEVTREEHEGGLNAKRVSNVNLSYYSQSSLASGYVFHGFTYPGSNPTTSQFKILRESLNTGEVLFANGAASFINCWSAASLSSISYL